MVCYDLIKYCPPRQDAGADHQGGTRTETAGTTMQANVGTNSRAAETTGVATAETEN